MGCGCSKKKLPSARRASVPVDEPVMVDPRSYKNTTDYVLRSRNPRFAVNPGELVQLDPNVINHVIRNWIRRGRLVEETPIAA
jgi:hypothetical protein